MKKDEFLKELARCIVSLPKSEIRTHLDYYSEVIDDRIEEGMTEEQAVASLEQVEVIAAKILIDHAKGIPHSNYKYKPPSKKDKVTVNPYKWIVVIFLTIICFPVLIGIIVAIIGVYIGFLGAIIGIYAAVISVAVAALSSFFGWIFMSYRDVSYIIISCGLGLLFTGLSIFGFAGAKALTAWIVKGHKYLFEWLKLMWKKFTQKRFYFNGNFSL